MSVAGIALKSRFDLISIMVPLQLLKEFFPFLVPNRSLIVGIQYVTSSFFTILGKSSLEGADIAVACTVFVEVEPTTST